MGTFLKILWIALILFSIYVFGWTTFIYLIFGNGTGEKQGFWNLVAPNILTVGLLIIYLKELLVGYKAQTKNGNLKSLGLLTVIVVVLIAVQKLQLDSLFDDIKSESWQITISLIVILTSYIGLLANRILKIKELRFK